MDFFLFVLYFFYNIFFITNHFIFLYCDLNNSGVTNIRPAGQNRTACGFNSAHKKIHTSWWKLKKKKNTNVNIYLMYFFASKQRRKRWTFLLFISNYVLGLIDRGHTHVCLRWWSGGSGVWQWPQFTKRRRHSFTAVKFTPSLSLIFFSKEQKCALSSQASQQSCGEHPVFFFCCAVFALKLTSLVFLRCDLPGGRVRPEASTFGEK